MDEFATVARKYQLMFGLTDASAVLLSGDFFTSKASEFGRAFDQVFCEDPAVGAEVSRRYDLICMDGRSLSTTEPITDAVAARLAQLSTGGSLVLALTNRHALDYMVARFRGRIPAREVAHTPSAARAVFRRSHAVVDEYLVDPSLHTPEEFVRSHGANIELPTYASAIHKAAARIGAYRMLHADMIMIASNGESGGMRTVPDIVERSLGLDARSLIVERFALRERGALILMLRHSTEELSLVVRVATAVVTKMLARNADLTDELLDSRLSSSFRHLIPRTLLRLPHQGGEIFVEERRAGTLAWKVVRKGTIADRLLSDAIQFALALDAATRHVMQIDEPGFAHLAGDAIQTIRAALHEATNAIDAIEHSLRRSLLGRLIDLVVGHGDYGCGNLLCDPSSGALTGVIDWDTHVRHELPGVDLCNLMLQDALSRAAGNADAALTEVVTRCATDEHVSGYPLVDTAPGANAWKTPLVLAVVRLVRRSAMYNTEFIRTRESHIHLLHGAAKLLR